jgi:putative ABC transport system substrate-binding protein
LKDWPETLVKARIIFVVTLASWLALFPTLKAAAAEESGRTVRIGILAVYEGAGAGMRRSLQSLGWVEGKNVIFDYRHVGGDTARLPEVAAALVRAKPDLIVAWNNSPAFAARAATNTIPIVVWAAHGALATGLVTSLRRPSGNLTGTESLAPELDAKRMELLKQIVPGLAQVAVLYDSGDQGSAVHLKSTQAAGQTIGVAISTLEVGRAEDFEPVLSGSAGKRLGGVLTFTSALTYVNWQHIMDFTLANRLPTVCEFKQLTQAGCMLSYGPTFSEFNERTAAQIDKILKGTPPGELPVEQMTRYELVINLKTARALGLTIPQSLLLRADEVIQ